MTDGSSLQKFDLHENSVVLAETHRKHSLAGFPEAIGISQQLLVAAEKGNLPALQQLYEHYLSQGMCSIDEDGSLLEACSALGWSCIHYAVASGSVPVVAWLVQQRVSVNSETLDGWTPLALAAATNQVQCMRYAGIRELAKSDGLLVDFRSDVRKTALCVAYLNGHVEAAEALIAAGATPIPYTKEVEEAPTIRLFRSASTGPENLPEELEVPPPFTGVLHFSGSRVNNEAFLMLLPQEEKLQRFGCKDDFYCQKVPESEILIADLQDVSLATIASKAYLVLSHRGGKDRYFSEFPEVTSEWLKQIRYCMQLHKERASLMSRKTSLGDMRRCMSYESMCGSSTPTETSMEREAELELEDFEALDGLGAGAFGKVYKVRMKDTGQLYALKVLSKKALAENKQLKLVLNEAKIHMLLDSPFIVKLHYKFQTPRKLYYVLDYCPNGDLGELISEKHTLPEESVRFYMAEVLIALQYLHSQYIVYRDMKPENIMLDAEGHIRLTDFGLAKQVKSVEAMNTTFCGTLAYLSPEMLMRKGVTKSADVYGAAAVMYELLAGESPHYSADMPTMLRNIKQGKLSFPWRTSPAAKSLLRAALSVNPEDRPTIEEMMRHEFFRGIDWTKVANRELVPPKLKSRPETPQAPVTLHDEDYSKTASMEECLLHF